VILNATIILPFTTAEIALFLVLGKDALKVCLIMINAIFNVIFVSVIMILENALSAHRDARVIGLGMVAVIMRVMYRSVILMGEIVKCRMRT